MAQVVQEGLGRVHTRFPAQRFHAPSDRTAGQAVLYKSITASGELSFHVGGGFDRYFFGGTPGKGKMAYGGVSRLVRRPA